MPLESLFINITKCRVDTFSSDGLLLAFNIFKGASYKRVFVLCDLLADFSSLCPGVCQGEHPQPEVMALFLKTEAEKPSSTVSYYAEVEAVSVKMLALREGFNLVGAESVYEHFLSLFLSIIRRVYSTKNP